MRIAVDGGWTLCLADGVVPDAGALDALLAHAGDATVLAGLVLGPREPVEDLLPRGPEDDPAGVIAAAAQRTLPLRRFTLAHTLVRDDVFARHGEPDPRYGPYAESVWSTRVARAEPGLFVPAAIARTAASPAAAGNPSAALRAARSGAWTPGESARALALALRPRRL